MAGFDEQKARKTMNYIIRSINYMHNKGVLHRDLKPENFVIDRKNGVVKLIDFGSAIQLEPKQTTKGREGTCLYMAPEKIEG